MLKLLIIEDDLYFTKTLINLLSKSERKLGLCTIATNGKEALKELENNIFDIILLDLKIPQYNGKKILDIISKQYIDNYRNSVIVISSYCEYFTKIMNNPCIYSLVNKLDGLSNILKEVKMLANIKEANISEQKITNMIINELSKINYNFLYSGTRYLVESIMLIIENKNFENINLKKDILPIIAKKNNKTASNIKMNINNATEMMFYDCSQEKLNDYFGYKVISKPKTKFVISTILKKLYINM